MLLLDVTLWGALLAPAPSWVPYVFGGLAAVAVVAFLLSARYERRRTEALSVAASQHGLSFQADGEPLAAEETAALHLFGTGRHREARNIMRGSSGGMEVVLFDYKYVTGSGKNQSVHRQTVAAFRVPGASLPAFQMRPESVFDRLASVLGFQDIDFPDHAEFSRRYLLRGKDESAVRAAFSPALIDFFEQLAAGDTRCSVEGAGNLVVVYRPEKRMRAEELPAFLQNATMIAAQFRQGCAMRFGH